MTDIDKANSLEFKEGYGIRLPRARAYEITRIDGKPLTHEDEQILIKAFKNLEECHDEETQEES